MREKQVNSRRRRGARRTEEEEGIAEVGRSGKGEERFD